MTVVLPHDSVIISSRCSESLYGFLLEQRKTMYHTAALRDGQNSNELQRHLSCAVAFKSRENKQTNKTYTEKKKLHYFKWLANHIKLHFHITQLSLLQFFLYCYVLYWLLLYICDTAFPHFLAFFYAFPCAQIISPRTSQFIAASLLFFCPSYPIWQISCLQPSLVPALQLRVAFPRHSARKLKTSPKHDPQIYFGTVLLNAERHTQDLLDSLCILTQGWGTGTEKLLYMKISDA